MPTKTNKCCNCECCYVSHDYETYPCGCKKCKRCGKIVKDCPPYQDFVTIPYYPDSGTTWGSVIC